MERVMEPGKDRMTAYWTIPGEDLVKKLASSAENGLTSIEAAARLKQTSRNLITSGKTSPAVVLFLNQFKSPIMLILIAATILQGSSRNAPDRDHCYGGGCGCTAALPALRIYLQPEAPAAGLSGCDCRHCLALPALG
jgi:hypothetical protein